MDLTFASIAPQETNSDLLAILIDDPQTLPNELKSIDLKLTGSIVRELSSGLVKQDSSSIALVTGISEGPSRIALVGYGPKSEGRGDNLRTAGAKIASTARSVKARSVAIAFPSNVDDLDALITGFLLGSFEVHRYTNSKDESHDSSNYQGPASLTMIGDCSDEFTQAGQKAWEIASAQNWARDLANAPANRMMPTALAAEARDLANSFEHLSFRELDRTEIEASGMGMFAAVAQGSADEPRLIVLEWNPPSSKESDAERLALVGKAVVFDTGGISIKPNGGMEDMKLDKAGGCAVIGAMRAIAATNVTRRVLAVVGSTTNMPDGNAYRPGDIVTAKDQTTVEIISTDAEGRLVLGDCITYARELGCGAIVEASTLTGAMVVALGHRFTGAIARQGSELLQAVLDAGARTGDHVWPLPIHDEYKGNLKTACADLRNCGSRDAGALSAGSFLDHFAKDTPFVHLDVAGTGMLPKARLWYTCKGASGSAMRLMVELASSR